MNLNYFEAFYYNFDACYIFNLLRSGIPNRAVKISIKLFGVQRYFQQKYYYDLNILTLKTLYVTMLFITCNISKSNGSLNCIKSDSFFLLVSTRVRLFFLYMDERWINCIKILGKTQRVTNKVHCQLVCRG